jgi:hypothetical protein
LTNGEKKKDWSSGSMKVGETGQGSALAFEPYVDADRAAAFLSVQRKTILEWARRGAIPAHPFGTGKRKLWRLKISELANCSEEKRSRIEAGSPEMAGLENPIG